jgi:hypothetical protein
MSILASLDEPRVYWSRSARTWLTDHIVEWWDRATGVRIAVPARFPTDLASVPFFLVPIVSMYGCWNRAAIVHDYLYSRRGVLPCGRTLTRKQADRIFLNIAVADGTVPFVALVGYYGIRINPANWPIFKPWGDKFKKRQAEKKS